MSPHCPMLGQPVDEPGEFCAVIEPEGCMVAADRLFIDRVEALVGRCGVEVIG